jgi:hypothetical protein
MNNDIDNKLTDKGWQAMREVLDREMPVQRRRRPVFWWWLGVLLLFPLLLTGGWLWYNQAFGPGNIQQTRPVTQPAPRKQASADDSPLAEQVRAPGAAMPLTTESASPSPANRQASQKGSTPNPMDIPRLKQTNAGQAFMDQNIVALPGDPAQQRETPRSYPVEALPGTDNATLPPVEQKIANGVEILPSTALPELSIAARAPNFMLVNTPVSTRVHADKTGPRLSFGAMAGMHTDRFTAINGFSAGAVMDWQLASKWGLRTGMQYAQYNPATSSRPYVALEDNIYANATGNFDVVLDNLATPATSPDSQPNPVLVPVDRIGRLEMPVLAYWQPLRPLRIFAGVTGSYSLSLKTSRQGFANAKVYNADSPSAEKNLSSLATEVLPRWNINLMFGTGFRIGRHFELDAFYRPGFAAGKGFDAAEITGQNNGAFESSAGPRSVDASSWFFLNGILFF